MYIELLPLGFLTLLAAIVRGYAGFGFSAIVITAASILISPVELVPMLYVLEIVASARMLRSVRVELDLKMLLFVLLGCIIALPLGLHLLVILPVDLTRLVIYCSVFICAAMVWKGFDLGCNMNYRLGALSGAMIGLGSGIGSIGGLPAMVIFLGTKYAASRTRAIFVAVFFVIYIIGTVVTYSKGLLTPIVLERIGWMLLPMILGVWFGEKLFELSGGKSFKKIALGLMIVLSVIGLMKIIWRYSF